MKVLPIPLLMVGMSLSRETIKFLGSEIRLSKESVELTLNDANSFGVYNLESRFDYWFY